MSEHKKWPVLSSDNQYDPLELTKVVKPLRYAGGESGQIKKLPDGLLRFCLVFPDIYEIGMSHTGYRIIYSRLNESPDISAERFFAPWPDAYEQMGKKIMVSLERRHPVRDFDVIGFSVQYEMSYTTITALLDMAGLPLLSKDRDDSHPIIIAGGSCVLNPAPLSAFIDVFFMGEMDGALAPAMEKLHQLRKNKSSRQEQLAMLNTMPFTYVPSVSSAKKTRKEIYKTFSSAQERLAPLVPLMDIVQDRVTAEIARGCTNGCRFCQAGMIYRPVREKGVASLCDSVISQLAATGYQEASLLSLDTGGYSQIEPLLANLSALLTPKHVSLSLPSLRAETVNSALMEKISTVRKSGFTIAPEAGSQRLRDIINKNLSEEEIINAAIYAKNAGYNSAKLYFMCGLPYETDEDILAIADLTEKIQAAVKGGKHFTLTVSVSNFVPKPFTPFERFGQTPPEELRRRHQLLKNALHKNKGVKLRFHDIHTSLIEAALSRGDDRWTDFLLKAREEGFYLDAWGEFFVREKWMALFDACGFSPEDIACRNWEDTQALPWDMTDSRIRPEWLLKENEKARQALSTADCRQGICTSCGVCDFKEIQNTAAPSFTAPLPPFSPLEQKKAYSRYELTFAKQGTASLLAALDTSRIFSHILLSQGVGLKFTEGFNPMPRIVVQAPLPVGVEGTAESVLFEADSCTVPGNIVEKLNRFAPEGITIHSVGRAEWPKNLSSYHMRFRFDESSFLFLQNALANQKAYYEKTGKSGKVKTVSLDDYLLSVTPDMLTVEVRVSEKGGFHFPEFFRKAGYNAVPKILRTHLTPAAP